MSQVLSPITSSGRIRWLTLAIYYSIVNLFHVGLWNTKFWDDWYQYSDIKNLESAEKACPVDSCGKIPLTYLWEQPLFSIGGWTLRLAVILAFALSGWAFWMILGRLKCLTEVQRSMATVFFVLVPINGARVSFVTARASFMLALFLIGLLLLSSRSTFSTIVGGSLVAFAAFQPSIQFFLIVIPILLVGIDLGEVFKITPRTLIMSAAAGIVALSHRFLVPSFLVHIGVVSEPVGYNSIRPIFLVRAVLVCGALSAPLLVALARWLTSGLRSKPQINLTAMGLFILAAGTFPYMAVGHFPNLSDWVVVFLPDNSDWTSRYQLLQGPGYALVLAGTVDYLNAQWKTKYFNLIVAATVALGVTTFSTYYVDSLKQRDLTHQLSQLSTDFAGVRFLEFVDNAIDVNARGRFIRAYEWEGMAEKALGRDIEIWEKSNYQLDVGCTAERLGMRITIQKVSGRLKAILTRGEIVRISIDDLVACI